MQTSSAVSEDIVKTACRALVDARTSLKSEAASEALSRISALLLLRTRLNEVIARAESKHTHIPELEENLVEVEARLKIASERALELLGRSR